MESIFTMSLWFTPVFLVLIIFLVSYVMLYFVLSYYIKLDILWMCKNKRKVESIFTMSFWFTPIFLVLIIFLVSYVVSCCFFYLSSSCMPNECWQCFWIVNSSLLLWFIYYICYERLERKWNLSTVVNLDICRWPQLPLLTKTELSV